MEQTTLVPADDPGEVGPPVVRKRGRPRDPEADVRILNAAAALIMAHGYDSMTVDEVASRARVGKATVYRRWARKEDLAVAAMERIYDTEMPVPDTGSLEGDLTVAYQGLLAFANSPAGEAYVRTTVSESVRDPRIAALYRTAIDRVEANAEVVYERAIARGELTETIDTRWAVELLAGLIAFGVVTGRPLPREDEAAAFVQLTLYGLARRT